MDALIFVNNPSFVFAVNGDCILRTSLGTDSAEYAKVKICFGSCVNLIAALEFGLVCFSGRACRHIDALLRTLVNAKSAGNAGVSIKFPNLISTVNGESALRTVLCTKGTIYALVKVCLGEICRSVCGCLCFRLGESGFGINHLNALLGTLVIADSAVDTLGFVYLPGVGVAVEFKSALRTSRCANSTEYASVKICLGEVENVVGGKNNFLLGFVSAHGETLLGTLFGAETTAYAKGLVKLPRLGSTVNSESALRTILCTKSAVYALVEVASRHCGAALILGNLGTCLLEGVNGVGGAGLGVVYVGGENLLGTTYNAVFTLYATHSVNGPSACVSVYFNSRGGALLFTKTAEDTVINIDNNASSCALGIFSLNEGITFGGRL